MRTIRRVSLCGVFIGILSFGMCYPAWSADRPLHPAPNNDTTLLRLLNQQLREQAHFQTGLPSPGSVRILRTLVVSYGAAVVGTYPLRHAGRGCSGTLYMTAFRSRNRWVGGGLSAHKTCLSARLPLEFVWSWSVWGDHTLLVVSGRALPDVASLRIFRGRRGTSVPLHNGAFVILGAGAGIRLVQALDSHNHVLYQTKPVG